MVLSGGIGPLLRREGLTCDSLVAVDMVDANVHATYENKHKDLFWAVCGVDGGNFGVITPMEIKVYPAPDVTWFNLGWNWQPPIEQVINAWQDFFAKLEYKSTGAFAIERK